MGGGGPPTAPDLPVLQPKEAPWGVAPADFSPWHYLLPPLLTFWPSFSPIIRPLPSLRASSLRCSLLSARHLSSPAYSNPQPGSCPWFFSSSAQPSVRPLSPEASQI